jgi:hypothetical protein
MRGTRILGAVSGLLLFGGSAMRAQVTSTLTSDPREAAFVYDDVRNFVRVFALLATSADTVGLLQSEYIDRATPGLREFIKKYPLTAGQLAEAVRRQPAKYAVLEGTLEWLRRQEGQLRALLARFREVVPNAVFPPTYYVVDASRGIASGSAEGQLLSVEHHDTTRLAASAFLASMVIHELTHFQQVMAVGMPKYQALYGPERSLLGLTLREGTAEFVANLVTGRMSQERSRQFVLAHEQQLWEQFRMRMAGAETGDFMWSTPANRQQPPNTGYVLGARIVEAFYDRASDKPQAMRDILSNTDYAGFLARSGYAARFDANPRGGESPPRDP